MWVKCIIACRCPDIDSGGNIDYVVGKVYEVSERYGSWLIGCYDRNFEVAPKPKPKAKAKPKAKGKGK